MARPTDYTTDLGIEIAALIAEGSSLRQISEMDGMPGLRTMLRWSTDRDDFRARLDRARLDKADLVFEEAMTIADEPVVDNAQAARNRLRVETRLKVAARLNPAKYAERLGIGAAPGLPALNPGAIIDPVERRRQEFDTARRIAYALQLGLTAAALVDTPVPHAAETRLLVDGRLMAYEVRGR